MIKLKYLRMKLEKKYFPDKHIIYINENAPNLLSLHLLGEIASLTFQRNQPHINFDNLEEFVMKTQIISNLPLSFKKLKHLTINGDLLSVLGKGLFKDFYRIFSSAENLKSIELNCGGTEFPEDFVEVLKFENLLKNLEVLNLKICEYNLSPFCILRFLNEAQSLKRLRIDFMFIYDKKLEEIIRSRLSVEWQFTYLSPFRTVLLFVRV